MGKIFVIINIFISSIIINSTAPLMPVFQNYLGISISRSSYIPVFGVLGTTIFSFLMSILVSKFGLKKSNYFGYFLLFLGLLFFSFSKNFFGIILASFLAGASTAVLFTSLTTLLIHLENPRFGLTHAFFGLGGIVAPTLVSFSIKSNFSYRYLYMGYFLVVIIIFIWNIFIKLPDAKYETMKFNKIKKTILKPVFFISIISFFLYSGSEIGLVTWSSNLFIHFGFSEDKAALVISMFWIFYTLSRFLSDFVLKLISEKKIAIFSTFFASFLIFFMLLTKNAYIFPLVGFTMGSTFPMIQRYANMNLNKEEVGLLNGVTYGSTGIGGILFSYSMGFLSDFSIPAMFVLPLVGLILVAIVQLLWKRGNRG